MDCRDNGVGEHDEQIYRYMQAKHPNEDVPDVGLHFRVRYKLRKAHGEVNGC